MQAVATRRPMAKTKPQKVQSSTSVKVHDDVLELARIIASYRGTETITEIISNNIRPILLKLQEEEAAKFAKRTGGK